MRLLRGSAMALAIAAAGLAATPRAAADDRGGGPDYYGVPYPLSWHGSYAGVHLGFGDGDGVVGGGQIGYNWQSGRIVYGIEADFALSSMEDEASGCIPGAGCVFAGASLDWLATVRGRVGYLIDLAFWPTPPRASVSLPGLPKQASLVLFGTSNQIRRH